MSIYYYFNSENKSFKPFKKGDRLLNNIYISFIASNKIYYIFSTSHCKNKKMCALSIDKSKTSIVDIAKAETILKTYTWTITNSTIKTSDNGISYTFQAMLNRYNVNLNYTSSIETSYRTVPEILKIFWGLIYSENISS